MKKGILFCVTLALLVAVSVPLLAAVDSAKLVGKWKLVKKDLGGTIQTDVEDLQIEFLKDGAFNYIEKGKVTMTMFYSLKDDTVMMAEKKGGDTMPFYTIKTLTDTELNTADPDRPDQKLFFSKLKK